MDDILTRFVSDLFGRMHGPFAFRFVLQPNMATGERQAMLHDGWKAVTRVIIVLLVAFVPYLLMRGPVNRIARRWLSEKVAAR